MWCLDVVLPDPRGHGLPGRGPRFRRQSFAVAVTSVAFSGLLNLWLLIGRDGDGGAQDESYNHESRSDSRRISDLGSRGSLRSCAPTIWKTGDPLDVSLDRTPQLEADTAVRRPGLT